MYFRGQRTIRNDFSDKYWRAKIALNRRDDAEATTHLSVMKQLRCYAERQLLPDETLSKFDDDIARIERLIAGRDESAA